HPLRPPDERFRLGAGGAGVPACARLLRMPAGVVIDPQLLLPAQPLAHHSPYPNRISFSRIAASLTRTPRPGASGTRTFAPSISSPSTRRSARNSGPFSSGGSRVSKVEKKWTEAASPTPLSVRPLPTRPIPLASATAADFP